MSDEEDRPESDEASPEETVVSQEDDGDEEWSPFDEVGDEYAVPKTRQIMASDGLPTQIAPPGGSNDIPPLSTTTLICMADESKFVLRDEWGEPWVEWPGDKVERAANGMWRARWKDADFGSRQDDRKKSDDWTRVDPIRPPCEHYIRQWTQFDLNTEAGVMLRLCAVRRTTEGAMMSLRDRAMYACDARVPRVLDAEKEWIDAFDKRKIAQGEHREYVPIFAAGGKANDG